ncbi:complex I NDUFA9 subunit family protein [Sphingosinicella rhizophila]|uniref:Complex I NDUFA9 subunit family protein n=1 Tax=Sphingosinicella rhizophila TaxID=3050082 RepID=A0ABU3Q4G2_9SPHN|nr:complex I NDUFA9 subunit family protein [Sphingosinicella sp. GR2756]MDT9598197.1 complex I NDUFA9 subunit family protein [Sphingosinicella sp. GR2756]
MVEKTDRLVTVFGGGGFVGRYVVQALHRSGARIRIAERNPRRAYFLKPLGGVGQTQFVRAEIGDAAAVRRAVQGSTAVINLVGILDGDMEAVHVDGARNVAEAAAQAGAGALVHMSAIGADPESESLYGRTKGQGEQAVRAAFPQATIMRPSIIFGHEDHFINRFAGMARLMPVMPVIRGPVRFQPVYVGDVGRAIAAAALDRLGHGAKTYELGGPQLFTMRALMEWVCRTTGHDRTLVDVPDPIARLIARLTGWAPGAPITWDQWLMLQKDNVVSPGAKGLEAFGLTKTPLDTIAEGWIASYRRHGRFAVKSPY